MDRFKFDHAPISVSANQKNTVNGCGLLAHNDADSHPSLFSATNVISASTMSSGSSSNGGSSYDNEKADFFSAVFKYISEMLMDEDLESRPCMLQDCLALQAAEKSFYDVLGHKYPPSADHFSPGSDLNVDCSTVSSSDRYTTANNLADSFLIADQVNFEHSHKITYSFSHPDNTLLSLESYGNIQHLVQFKEAHDAAYAENDSRYNHTYRSRGRKNCQCEDGDYLEEGRSNKQSAPSLTESQLSDKFDKVLLSDSENVNDESISCPIYEGAQKKANENVQLKGPDGRRRRRRRPRGAKKQGSSEREVMDLWGLLSRCAQAVSSSDQRKANELLRQIGQHSSPYGDATQRVAHYFANALEVRLVGTNEPMHTPVVSSKSSAVDGLKGYQAYISVCPFRLMSDSFTNRTIAKLAENATRIHIIDFGILYGFQWPGFIQRVSKRPGGPPKLRITGIDFPQPGFRPAERVEGTGRLLKSYCERFNVPFEYNAIAQKWETIRLEDIKIDRKELTVVSCLYRLKNLPDDTMVLNGARDSVLKLIKRMEPDLFIHGVINGTYNGPFFATRFREALFFYSTLFDIFEASLPREDEGRLMFEREVLGKDALNVIACEGSERIERPETYKQWQARNLRIGFRQLPLDHDVLMQVREAVKSKYHKDFAINEDGKWMLQGWKGRTVYALSCWKPGRDQHHDMTDTIPHAT